MEDYGFTPLEFFSFRTSDGVELNAAMIKPWNFDENKQISGNL
jgi:dipeptidyl-peptidase 4